MHLELRDYTFQTSLASALPGSGREPLLHRFGNIYFQLP
jgi:hypothetical protein